MSFVRKYVCAACQCIVYGSDDGNQFFPLSLVHTFYIKRLKKTSVLVWSKFEREKK